MRSASDRLHNRFRACSTARMRWLLGSEFRPRPEVLAALTDVLGDAVADVRVFEHSLYARLHHARAVTRPGRIYVAGAGEELCASPELLLHEYCHVLHQWRTRELTRLRYVIELLRRGYWHNRFEIAARDFASRELERLEGALRRNRS
jgi:hypothetical protein